MDTPSESLRRTPEQYKYHCLLALEELGSSSSHRILTSLALIPTSNFTHALNLNISLSDHYSLLVSFSLSLRPDFHSLHVFALSSITFTYRQLHVTNPRPMV